jgi:hypothetical protein
MSSDRVRDSFFLTSSNCRTIAGGRETVIISVVRIEFNRLLSNTWYYDIPGRFVCQDIPQDWVCDVKVGNR